MKATAPLSREELLATAFSDFISASAKLELSYRDLQAEVAELSLALTQRSQELHVSRKENKNMGLTLQRIVEAMPCGVLVVNTDGSVLLANPEAERILALSVTQMPTLQDIHTRSGLDLRALSREANQSGSEQELCFTSSTGRHWIAARRVTLPALDGGIRGRATTEAVLTLQDISERKRLEGEREAARDAVALAQVSALLAHEIRNPLASLELFAGLIADSPDQGDQWISHLRAGIRVLSGTVNNVLTLHGGPVPTMEVLEVAVEASLAVDFLQPLARQSDVTLTLDTSTAWPTIRANKSAFHQILLNLCSNALRHTPARGSVRVSCPTPACNGLVTLAVADSGTGIAEDHLGRIFEGGFSGSGLTPGLGLAVCERLMRQHGGSIRVESRLRHGSTFTLEFQQA